MACLLLLSACSKRPESSVDGVVRIGMAAPLTGPQSDIGLDIQRGIQLGVDDVNASGLVIGGKPVKFELLSEDDEANSTKATTVAQKLVDSGVVAVVGHFNSGSSIPASRIYADAGIPQVSPGTTAPRYTQQGYATTFRLVANDDQQGPAMAAFAVNTLKAKRVAVIDDSTAYGQGLAAAFAARAKAAGVEIVAQEHTTDKDTDFTAILTNIKSKNPQYVFFGGIYSQGAPMAKQMKALGLDAPLLGGDGIQTPKFIEVAGSAGEGTYASIPGLPKDRMPGGRAFLEKFQARFHRPVELFAPMGYDAVFVIADAMKRANSTQPARFLPELKKTRIQGVTGPIEFDEHGDLKNGPITINVVKDGKWVAEETVIPPAATAQP
ncbi:MAG: branched-chain amino acid ABC transporter substrate-binding protein [Proteobacteria bacterium]|nr:branched-chain amino acid ABC transporter substrate-binding protein [Pseudomonadota bacterium]